MKYELNDFNRNIPDSELLADMVRVAKTLRTDSLSSRDYNDNGGKYTAGTIGIRFGSWNSALKKAGLQLVNQRDVSEDELFHNLEAVWINVGRQPVFRDMKPPLSKYSTHQYISKFGTWREALQRFVFYVNSDNPSDKDDTADIAISNTFSSEPQIFKHKTKRFPSERLKVQVLMRDGNKCRLCGIVLTGGNIHFDHIVAWSKGGETTLENLQILCAAHNLAKGDI
jgi:hypothetical protein